MKDNHNLDGEHPVFVRSTRLSDRLREWALKLAARVAASKDRGASCVILSLDEAESLTVDLLRIPERRKSR